jgi:hypothetical protein
MKNTVNEIMAQDVFQGKPVRASSLPHFSQ